MAQNPGITTLSAHSFLKLTKIFLLQLQDKDWDYSLFSKASWINNEYIAYTVR